MALYLVVCIDNKRSLSPQNQEMLENMVLEYDFPDFGRMLIESIQACSDLETKEEELATLNEMLKGSFLEILGLCTEITQEISQTYAKSLSCNESPIFIEVKPVKISVSFPEDHFCTEET